MAHERHAHVGDDAGFHQAGVEGMAKVVKAEMAEAGTLEGAQPAFPDP